MAIRRLAIPQLAVPQLAIPQLAIRRSVTDWLERRYGNPSYSGWLMGGLAIFFFAAATNTMAGWLYAMSGLMLSLLVIAAVASRRSLVGLTLHRSVIKPVSAGEPLSIDLTLHNTTHQSKALIQLRDQVPMPLQAIGQPNPIKPDSRPNWLNAKRQPNQIAIDRLPPQSSYRWLYQYPTHQRGIYQWQTVLIRTAAPLGLFWYRQEQPVAAQAIVYPTVLSLSRCPLLDQTGAEVQPLSEQALQAATEGLTRTLRPYRWGDSTRLIHWRTSARYGALQVRELETPVGGPSIVIGLDCELNQLNEFNRAIDRPFNRPLEGQSSAADQAEWFEQAVIAAASLYFYGVRQNWQVQLWTAATGIVQGDREILETLAGVSLGQTASKTESVDWVSDRPVLWLTQCSTGLSRLPVGSRWLLWSRQAGAGGVAQLNSQINSQINGQINSQTGWVIDPDRSLQSQLEGVS